MKRNTVPASVWKNPLHFVAFGFGSGAAPYAPGTFGTLLAVPIYLLLAPLVWWMYLLFVMVMFVFGVWLSDLVEREIGGHDHPGMNFDEFVGYWLTMFLAPAGWQWIIIGFVLFRLFDIWKPWPINIIDKKVAGGFGVMFDDVVAALYAWIVLQLLVFVL